MEPWQGEDAEQRAEARRRLLERLRLLSRGSRTSLVRFGADLRVVLHNQRETRRFLAGTVYRVPDRWLDDLVRVRLHDLEP